MGEREMPFTASFHVDHSRQHAWMFEHNRLGASVNCSSVSATNSGNPARHMADLACASTRMARLLA